MSLPSAKASRLATTAVLAVLAAFALGGCKTTSRNSDVTGSIGPRTEAEWRRSAEAWGEQYRRDTKNVEAAINYAQALRATEQREQAVAVLEQTAVHNPQDRALLGAYGRALADVGRLEQALDVLSRAHTPDQPDWRILSVQGAVLDQLGRHAEAQRFYSNALKIQPNDPGVLTNMGLSYALTKDLKLAEQTLRQAVAQPGADIKARQNLALVLGLQGRFDEAETLARADLPPDQAAANVAELRKFVAEHKERNKIPDAPKQRKRVTPKQPT